MSALGHATIYAVILGQLSQIEGTLLRMQGKEDLSAVLFTIVFFVAALIFFAADIAAMLRRRRK